jgi:hypothetical protein
LLQSTVARAPAWLVHRDPCHRLPCASPALARRSTNPAPFRSSLSYHPQGKFVTFYGKNFTKEEMARNISDHVKRWQQAHPDWKQK